MTGRAVESFVVRLINALLLLLGVILLGHIHTNDPSFFSLGNHILSYIGTVLILLCLLLSGGTKLTSMFWKFFGWLPVGSFVSLMLFLINLIFVAIFVPLPAKTIPAVTNFAPHFIILLSLWFICDVFTFAYVYPDKAND